MAITIQEEETLVKWPLRFMIAAYHRAVKGALGVSRGQGDHLAEGSPGRLPGGRDV